jgi:hypothetical protein
MTELCTLSHGSWWADIKFYVWFSAKWNKKVALQMLTLPDSQAHEKCLFCASNGWTSHHDYGQFLKVISVFVGIFAVCSKKWHQNMYWAVLTLPDNKNIWEMDHFWWTSDDWTLSLVIGQVYTVTKIAEGILLFVKNDNLPNTCWMQPFPRPNNKITWKMDHFSCTSNELSVCLFKITFEK